MSAVSIIIPVFGSLQGMEETLVSVLENRPADSQIIVALSRPYDDPYDLKDEVDFLCAPEDAPLATLLNMALEACRAPVVHVLACGVQATAGWADAALAPLSDPQVAMVAPLMLQKDDPQRVVAAGVRYRPGGALYRLGQSQPLQTALETQTAPHGPDLRAAFYRKSDIETVGGFDETVGDELLAADIALALRAAGLRCVFQPQCRTYADHAPVSPAGALQRGFEAEQYFWRRAASAGWSRSLACHAVTLIAESLQCPLRPTTVLRLMGRAAGALWSGIGSRHRQRTTSLSPPRREAIVPPHFAKSPEIAARAHCGAASGEAQGRVGRRG